MSNTRMKGERVTPHDTLSLMKSIGTTRAAKALGVSTSTLHTARRKRSVSRVVEIAAAGLLRRDPIAAVVQATPAPANDTGPHTMCLLDVPTSKLPLVQRFAEALGAEYLAA